MLKLVTKWKKWLWEFVELSFIFLLALILLHLLLGSAGGPYLAAVAENVTKFATAGGGGMLGIVLVLGIVYFVLKRRGWSHTADE